VDLVEWGGRINHKGDTLHNVVMTDKLDQPGEKYIPGSFKVRRVVFDAYGYVTNVLEELDLFNKAERIFVFVGFGSEITTEIFIKKHLANKQIYVPKIVNGDMKLVNITRWDSLKPGHFNVLEPENDDFYNGSVDLVITPSIVFNKQGYRLGYGKGYYDKYFSQNNYKVSIGLSYDQLLQDNIPTEEHDQKVGFIITEKGIITC